MVTYTDNILYIDGVSDLAEQERIEKETEFETEAAAEENKLEIIY